MSSFEKLNQINVNQHTEEKNGLTYLTWSWAWSEFKKQCPNATYTIFKNENGLPFVYDENTGYMVYTSVTVDNLTHEMWLPVMDGSNMAMKASPYTYKVKNKNHKYATLDKDTGKYFDRYGNEQPPFVEKTCDAATMFDINKAIMRCLVKNLAMFGLGLYIYAGEDLPQVEQQDNEKYLQEQISEKDIGVLRELLQPHQVDWVLNECNVESLSELTNQQFGEIMRAMNQKRGN